MGRLSSFRFLRLSLGRMDDSRGARRDDETSITLLNQARDGHSQATARLVATYTPYIRQVARYAGVTNQQDLEDLAQETLSELFRKLPTFERERTGSLRRWLKVVAQRVAIHIKTRRAGEAADPQRLEELQSLDDRQFDELVSQMDAGEVIRSLWRLLAQEFTDEQLAIFEQRTLQDAETEAVARQYQVSLNVVHLTRSRVMKRLRELAQEFYGADPFGT